MNDKASVSKELNAKHKKVSVFLQIMPCLVSHFIFCAFGGIKVLILRKLGSIWRLDCLKLEIVRSAIVDVSSVLLLVLVVAGDLWAVRWVLLRCSLVSTFSNLLFCRCYVLLILLRKKMCLRTSLRRIWWSDLTVYLKIFHEFWIWPIVRR